MATESSAAMASESIQKAAHSLFTVLKYIYSAAENDFYNVSVKDIFRISLGDVTTTVPLANMAIPYDETRLGAMNTPEFKNVEKIIYYAFAIRLPFMAREANDGKIRDGVIRELYEDAEKKGAENCEEIIEEDFRSMLKLAKSKQPEPLFGGEWFRRWVYTGGGEFAELSAINNRNLFLLGCADALFPLFYAALREKLAEPLKELQN